MGYCNCNTTSLCNGKDESQKKPKSMSDRIFEKEKNKIVDEIVDMIADEINCNTGSCEHSDNNECGYVNESEYISDNDPFLTIEEFLQFIDEIGVDINIMKELSENKKHQAKIYHLFQDEKFLKKFWSVLERADEIERKKRENPSTLKNHTCPPEKNDVIKGRINNISTNDTLMIGEYITFCLNGYWVVKIVLPGITKELLNLEVSSIPEIPQQPVLNIRYENGLENKNHTNHYKYLNYNILIPLEADLTKFTSEYINGILVIKTNIIKPQPSTFSIPIQ